MKIVQGDEVEWLRGLQHRGGTFHYRHLLNGERGTLGNFQLSVGRQDGDFASPRKIVIANGAAPTRILLDK